MIVHVTQDDIDRARKILRGKKISVDCILRSCVCPVALALHRSGLPEAQVSDVYVAAALGSEEVVFLPAEAVAWIQRFDRGEDVQPFSFQLEIKSS